MFVVLVRCGVAPKTGAPCSCPVLAWWMILRYLPALGVSFLHTRWMPLAMRAHGALLLTPGLAESSGLTVGLPLRLPGGQPIGGATHRTGATAGRLQEEGVVKHGEAVGDGIDANQPDQRSLP